VLFKESDTSSIYQSVIRAEGLLETRCTFKRKGRDMTDVSDDTLRTGILGGVGLLAVFVLGMLVVSYGVWKWDSGRTDEAVKQTEDELVRAIDSQLPVGTPHDEIEKFAAAHGLKTFYLNFRGPSPLAEGATALLAAQTTPAGNMIHSCWVPLIFRLDGSDALMGYSHETRCKSGLISGTRDKGTPLQR
jgi:hypothetical protein